MALGDTPTDVFKFVALRPPATPARDATDTHFIRDDRQATQTPVGRFVAQFNQDNAATFPDKLREFIKEQQYDLTYPQSAGDKQLDAIVAAARAVPVASVSTDSVTAAVEEAVGRPVKDLYGSETAANTRHAIWDRYYAFYLLNQLEGTDLTPLTNNLRAYHLLRILSQGGPLSNAVTLSDILSAKPVIDKLFASIPKPKAPDTLPQPDHLPADKVKDYQDLWSNLIATQRALDEVRALPVITATKEETEPIPIAQQPLKLREATLLESPQTKHTRVTATTAVDPAAIAALRPETKQLLSSLRVEAGTIRKPDTVAALTTRMRHLNDAVSAIDDARFLDLIPKEATEIRGFSTIASRLKDHRIWPIIKGGNVRGQMKPLGIGDLKVVKQKLKSYQLGEVAHIENVLRGEYKERKYRVLDRTEETLTVSEETQEETTKDVQTTERFELKKESENTIQEQMSVQAGVTVSGSYGMVTFGAHGDFAYSTSSQESQKNSSNYAREVVDRSVTRIQKNVKQERVTKQLHEVEEIDTHGLDNKGQPDNLTGVYRWVDKYYEAQIYNYGKRMMFEYIIPEPSAFFQYAQTHQPKENITSPPALGNITHKDITDINFNNYIRDYQVQGCTPPPPEYKNISVTLSSDANIDNGTSLAKSTKDLVVPEGYTAEQLSYSLSFVFENYPQVKLSLGADDAIATWTNNTARRRADSAGGSPYLIPYDGIIPVALVCYDVNAYFANVVATCHRTPEKYEAWQITTFEKITAAYTALKAAYDQKVRAQESQQVVQVKGQNPRINREIEKTELKKGSIKLLMDTWEFASFQAMKQSGDDPPDFDIFDAVKEGKIQQFFEQAFEWENITYLFYPYFWGRTNQWIGKINNYDEDPLFTQFLQAGAARVVVPVHPGYNDAIMYFLENNGAIWNGGEPPRLNDPMFIALADELREQTDDLAGATPEGDPWEVILPTTLVYLQKDASLPAFP